MTDLFEKSLHTLELPQVLELLAHQAVCEDAKERCLALRPSVQEAEVLRLLEETTAARNMMDVHGSPAIARLKPVAAILQRASLGGSLNNKELLTVARVLRTAREVNAYSGFGETPTILAPLFRSLTANSVLENKITGAILSEEEIADNASPALADIRRHIRAASGKARDVLQKLISSPTNAKYLQEAIITIRNGRFVVPVKSECKGSVPGLVHDVSATGSTFFVEPMAAVQANNELRELLSKEEKEIARILAALSAECADHKEDILLNYDLLLQLDVIFARGKLSYAMRGMCPRLVEDGSFHFKKARHPLLDAKKAVPITIYLGEGFDTLVITGPNTGGKTVTLKTAGLLTVMAQCGLHIPVDDDSTFSVFHEVLADIGDEQSIEQSLSTFSSHITNIVKILDEADDRTLVLIDELGAGTDPIEGAALAVAIIEEARSIGAKVAATTHYAELKVYAMTTPGVENASCEFNVETLQPTYRLLIGIPGKSNAFAISRRLGLAEHIIENAGKRINSQDVQFEDVLTQLERQRQEMESERMEARRLRRKLEVDAAAMEESRRVIDEERSKVVDKAKNEARQIIDDARNVSNRVFNELDNMKKRQKEQLDAEVANAQRAELRRKLNKAEEKLGERKIQQQEQSRPAEAGDTVELIRLGTRAQVVSINKDGTLQLKAGILNVTAKQEEVRVVSSAPKQTGKKPMHRPLRSTAGTHQVTRSGATRELDIRGMMCDEGIALTEQFLDSAVMGHLTGVSIIHGKGTGALRKAVHNYLRTCKYVKAFRLGRYGEGEDGVTIVELK
ncbi:MAG: endonuclease MutS2 [Oscillospiraceae bacterium]|nr:endonuclease MutS2 [Oscillospiraceae bacterium]